MDASFMSSQQHERGIHVVWPGAGEGRGLHVASAVASAAGLVAAEDLARGGQQLGPDRGRVQDLDLITESG